MYITKSTYHTFNAPLEKVSGFLDRNNATGGASLERCIANAIHL